MNPHMKYHKYFYKYYNNFLGIHQSKYDYILRRKYFHIYPCKYYSFYYK